jgi:hypothetical protein
VCVTSSRDKRSVLRTRPPCLVIVDYYCGEYEIWRRNVPELLLHELCMSSQCVVVLSATYEQRLRCCVHLLIISLRFFMVWVLHVSLHVVCRACACNVTVLVVHVRVA